MYRKLSLFCNYTIAKDCRMLVSYYVNQIESNFQVITGALTPLVG